MTSRIFILSGAMLLIAGLMMRSGLKIPWLGRLPGDIYVKRANLTFYFPLTTSLIISVILSMIFYLLGKR